MSTSDPKDPANASLTEFLRSMAEGARLAVPSKTDAERIVDLEARVAELEGMVLQRPRTYSFFPQGAGLDSLVLESLARLRHLGPATTSRVAADTGIAFECVSLALDKLRHRGAVVRVQTGAVRGAWELPRPAAH